MEQLVKREEAVRGPQGLPNKGQVQSQTSVRGTSGTAFPAESEVTELPGGSAKTQGLSVSQAS